ncbi:MAG: LysM peptidoglycan-binding domain-containing protein, partial [Bryobacterales bacterium]|nr:LysM peptidoglycan-binding domain-containing protein [Bryobacterales bacterium]
MVDRGPAAAAAAPAVPRAGYHIVKKGDTLYSIAQEHGQDWRDVKAWNAIDNPNLLRIGQELRVESPDGAAVSKPVAAPAAIDVRPLGPAAAAPAVDAARPAAGADSRLPCTCARKRLRIGNGSIAICGCASRPKVNSANKAGSGGWTTNTAIAMSMRDGWHSRNSRTLTTTPRRLNCCGCSKMPSWNRSASSATP